jgi:hypothetical protein
LGRALARRQPEQKPYSSRIIKAGALLADTTLLLSHWDASVSSADNLDRIRNQNLFGKASRSRVEDILAIFRQRYLSDPGVAVALSALVQAHVHLEIVRPLLYFHSCQSDRLLHDVVVRKLEPKWAAGEFEVNVPEIESVLDRWADEGLTVGTWSPPTTRRIAHGLLATLRDFGILEGAARKRLTHPYLPPEAFAYIALYFRRGGTSGRALVDDPEWRLFFLGPDAVERLFVESQQRGLLHYQAAGTVVRIDFPTHSLEEYARALTERTH